MSEIELHRGTPFLKSEDLNRLARQQELSVVIAQAKIYDQICKEVELNDEIEAELIQSFLQKESIGDDSELEDYLDLRGWQEDDLIYVATKAERLRQFQKQVFSQEVELNYLSRKIDLDQVSYTLICNQDIDEAFEWHQRLLEGEADFFHLQNIACTQKFEHIVSGSYGPHPISLAHKDLIARLRVGQPGQLWPPFYCDSSYIVLRLEQRSGTPLNKSIYAELLEELFEKWLNERISQMLTGNQPPDLPLNLLSKPQKNHQEINIDELTKNKTNHDNNKVEDNTHLPQRNQIEQEWQISLPDLIGSGNCHYPSVVKWAEQKKLEELTDYESLLLSIFYRHSGDQPAAQRHVEDLTKKNLFDAYASMITSQCFDFSFEKALKTSFDALSKEVKKLTIWSHDQRSYFQDICKTLQYSLHLKFLKQAQNLHQCNYADPNRAQSIQCPGATEDCEIKISINSATFSTNLGLWINNDNSKPISNLLHPNHDFRGFVGNSLPCLHSECIDKQGGKRLLISDPTIYIDFNPHFGHFITHSCSFAIPLLAAESISEEKSQRKLIILSTSEISPWAQEILRAASSTHLDFIVMTKDCDYVEAEQLITAPPSWIEWHYCNSNHRKLFQEITKRLTIESNDINSEATFDMIYLSRSKVKQGLRISLNEEELEYHLIQRGFKIIHPQELTLNKLIHLISQCSLLAGPAGSAMHNILFAKNQSNLTTLNFDHHIAHNQILLENACDIKKNFHSFSTRQISREGKNYLEFDIAKCIEATDAAIKWIQNNSDRTKS